MGWFDSVMHLRHDAAFYTLWVSAGSIIAILATAMVALYGIFSGNRDKRRERAILLLRQAQSDNYRGLARALRPMASYSQARRYLEDSFEGTKTLDYTTLVNSYSGERITAPMTRQELFSAVIRFTNALEEVYIHLQYDLVDKDVILDALSAVVLPDFYTIEPLLTKFERAMRINFTPARQYALLAQQRLRKIHPLFDPALLNYTFSGSSPVSDDARERK